MADVNQVGITNGIPDTGTGTVDTLVVTNARIGEVQASPTANTALDRLKTLHTDNVAIEGYIDGIEANTASGAVVGAGTAATAQRTTLASDDPAVATLGATSGAAVITDANGTIQQYLRGLIKQWIAGTLVLGTGTNAIGTVAATAATSGGASLASAIVPNNTTAVVVKGSAGQVYKIEAFNNSATIAYLKIYDAASATAGSGTPKARYLIPANASGAGLATTLDIGDVYATGITYVVTTGIADNDTGTPAASTYIINVHYK